MQPLVSAIHPRRSASSELRQRIRRDILDGRYPPEVALPSIKELAARLGVCQPTLRKALRALVAESILVRQSHAYFPLSLATPATRARSRIVLLGRGPNIGHTITWGYWHQEYLKLLEMECARANIALDIVCFSRAASGALEFHDGRTHPASEPIAFTESADALGYLYEVVGTESFDDELLRMIAGWGKPLAVLDEMGLWPLAAFLSRHANIRVFRNTVSDVPAQQVARFVLELGHRTAVFISPDHATEYSKRRYQGLAQAFAAAGNARLIPLTSGGAGEPGAPATTPIDVDRLTRAYVQWKKDLPRDYTRLLDQHFAMIPSICQAGKGREITGPLLREALRLREATVWIAVNDECAHCAIDFLEDRRISVPEELAIVSFDDMPYALTLGLTSYNFGQAATALAMLRFITNPRFYPVSRRIIEIEGRIIPRRTTAGSRRALRRD